MTIQVPTSSNLCFRTTHEKWNKRIMLGVLFETQLILYYVQCQHSLMWKTVKLWGWRKTETDVVQTELGWGQDWEWWSEDGNGGCKDGVGAGIITCSLFVNWKKMKTRFLFPCRPLQCRLYTVFRKKHPLTLTNLQIWCQNYITSSGRYLTLTLKKHLIYQKHLLKFPYKSKRFLNKEINKHVNKTVNLPSATSSSHEKL